MNDLAIISTDKLPELTVAQIAALPVEHLQELDTQLGELTNWLKSAKEKFSTALEQRYGEPSRAARLAAGKDFGTVHVSDNDLRITADLPKKVTWDQPQLAAIARRIAASGDKVEDYIDVEFSISESRFNNWPPALKEQFTAARTVKPGKATFRLALVSEGGA